MADDFKARVIMVGGRRCGKTSVLATMQSNFETKFQDTDLNIIPMDLETLSILSNKDKEIKNYFLAGDRRTFNPDSNPTEDVTTYPFNINIKEKHGKIGVEFVDYPGEWIIDHSHNEQLLEEMKKSQAIVIAIDTPHMMEEDGLYNEDRNYCLYVCHMLRKAFEEGDLGRKLILFVPLKCEKYRSENKMEQVCLQVEQSYERLISYLAKEPNKYEVAITPIFTLGGAEFGQFERNRATGEILVDERFHTPSKATYFFPDKEVKKPTPQYCEQPIVYLLVYLLKSAYQLKDVEFKKGDIWSKLAIVLLQRVFGITSAKDYASQVDKLSSRLKKDGEGYKILQNPMKF